jgi:hypothetical protein
MNHECKTEYILPWIPEPSTVNNKLKRLLFTVEGSEIQGKYIPVLNNTKFGYCLHQKVLI